MGLAKENVPKKPDNMHRIKTVQSPPANLHAYTPIHKQFSLLFYFRLVYLKNSPLRPHSSRLLIKTSAIFTPLHNKKPTDHWTRHIIVKINSANCCTLNDSSGDSSYSVGKFCPSFCRQNAHRIIGRCV